SGGGEARDPGRPPRAGPDARRGRRRAAARAGHHAPSVSGKPQRDPDRMTFLEHLEELRVRLIRSVISLIVAFGICWNFSREIFHYLTAPMRLAYPDIKFIYTAP